VYIWLDRDYWALDTQTIVIFDVETASGLQDIQVFVGNDLTREENIDGRENIVIVYEFVPTAALFIRPKTEGEIFRFYKASVFIV
jgi:hypothetical protein